MSVRERRAHPRVRADLPVVAVVARSRRLAPGTRVPGRLIDVSAGGLAFEPAAPLQAGDLVRIAFGGDAAAVVPEAVVVRCDSDAAGTICACRFSELQRWLVEAVEGALQHA